MTNANGWTVSSPTAGLGSLPETAGFGASSSPSEGAPLAARTEPRLVGGGVSSTSTSIARLRLAGARSWLLAGALLSLGLSACGDEDLRAPAWDAGPRPDAGYPFVDAGADGGEVPDAGMDAGGPPTGLVRVAHLAPALGALDLYLPDSPIPVARNLAYRGASGYLRVPTGARELLGRPANEPPTADPLISLEVEVEETTRGLIAIAGAEGEHVRWVPDDADEPPIGRASARVLHAMQGLGEVSLDLDADRELDVAGLAPYAISELTSLEAESRGAALVLAELRELAITWEPIVDDGSHVIIALVGEAEGRGARAPGLLLILPAFGGSSGTLFLGADPEVAVLQAAEALERANVGVGELALGDLAYGELVPPSRVPPGNAFVNVFGEDRDGELVFAGGPTGELARGQRYLVVVGGATGWGGPRRFVVTTIRLALEEPGAAEARAHLVHVSRDAPAPLQLYVEGAAHDGAVAAYGSRTPLAGVALPSGPRSFGLASAGSPGPGWTFEGALPAGRSALVVAGRYFADDPADATALRIVHVDLDAWISTPWLAEPGSGPREGEEPPAHEDDDRGGGIGI
ncbi:MAG: DUF4397 domain-containing protein [Myxococcales bacterium]|nr:DUF4397 domain-containing protein [Myxococcales bacterium]